MHLSVISYISYTVLDTGDRVVPTEKGRILPSWRVHTGSKRDCTQLGKPPWFLSMVPESQELVRNAHSSACPWLTETEGLTVGSSSLYS